MKAIQRLIISFILLLIGGAELRLSAQEVGHKDTLYITSEMPVILELTGMDTLDTYEVISHMRISKVKTNEVLQVIVDTTDPPHYYDIISDVNFDGYNDLESYYYEASMKYYDKISTFWLFDTSMHNFIKRDDFTFFNLTIDSLSKRLTDGHEGTIGGSSKFRTFKVEDNKPVFLFAEVHDFPDSYNWTTYNDTIQNYDDRFGEFDEEREKRRKLVTNEIVENVTASVDTTEDGRHCLSVLFEQIVNGKLLPVKKMYANDFEESPDDTRPVDDNHICESDIKGTYCWFKEEDYSYGTDDQGEFIETTFQEVQQGGWVTTKTTKQYTDKTK